MTFEDELAMWLRLAKEHQRRSEQCSRKLRALNAARADAHPEEFLRIRLVVADERAYRSSAAVGRSPNASAGVVGGPQPDQGSAAEKRGAEGAP